MQLFAAPELHWRELAEAIVVIVPSLEFVNLLSSSIDLLWLSFALFVAWAEVAAIE